MIVSTPRLILRPIAATDYDALCRMWSEEPVYRYITGKPITKGEVWLRLLRDLGHWQVRGYGNWSVRLEEDGSYVGVVGLFDFKRDIVPPLDAIEVGWVFAGAFHGRGLASEALKAVLAYADGSLRLPKTTCIIDPHNIKSLRLANRYGYRRVEKTLFHGDEIFILERPRPRPL